MTVISALGESVVTHAVVLKAVELFADRELAHMMGVARDRAAVACDCPPSCFRSRRPSVDNDWPSNRCLNIMMTSV